MLWRWDDGGRNDRLASGFRCCRTPPTLGQNLGFQQCVEDRNVQHLVPQRPIERLVVAILPGTTRRDVRVVPGEFGPRGFLVNPSHSLQQSLRRIPARFTAICKQKPAARAPPASSTEVILADVARWIRCVEARTPSLRRRRCGSRAGDRNLLWRSTGPGFRPIRGPNRLLMSFQRPLGGRRLAAAKRRRWVATGSVSDFGFFLSDASKRRTALRLVVLQRYSACDDNANVLETKRLESLSPLGQFGRSDGR